MSKLNKKNCLKGLGNFTLIFLVFLLGSFQPPKSKPAGTMKVVIDAGHGGHDSGCLGKKTKEKDVALGIALKLGKFIEEHYSDVKVIYTRKVDEFVELHERAQIANNAKADLFICIHCNSACTFDRKRKKEICNREIEGVESWVMGLNKSDANLEVSKRENEVILLEKDYTSQYDGFDPNSPEANIIFSLYQNEFLEQSLRMATLVQQEVKGKSRAGRGVKQAGFLVLYKTTMPSILIETGFLSNEKEEKYLSSVSGQEEIATAIFKAFQQYKGTHENLKEPESGKDKSVQIKDTDVEKTTPKMDEKSTQVVKSVDKPLEKFEKSTDKLEDKQPDKSIEKSVEKSDTDKTAAVIKSSPNDVPKKITEPVLKTDSIPVNTNDILQWGVQFYTSGKAVPDSHKLYKDFHDVREDYDGGIYKYSTGLSTSRQEAIQMQNKIRTMGYKDAFVVAFLNNKKISVKEAMEMEKKRMN